MKNKPFDPISVDNIDIVDDWTVEKDEIFSADEGYSWMVLDLPTASGAPSQYACNEDFDTFLLGTTCSLFYYELYKVFQLLCKVFSNFICTNRQALMMRRFNMPGKNLRMMMTSKRMKIAMMTLLLAEISGLGHKGLAFPCKGRSYMGGEYSKKVFFLKGNNNNVLSQ